MSETAENTMTESYTPRLKSYYEDEVVARLTERFGYTNRHAVPELKKIVLNMGLGSAIDDKNVVSDALELMRTIAGQQPVVTKSKRAVSQFKLREGVPIGCMVTLRGGRMWEFIDRLISIVLPRVRDFRGVATRGFDGTGNYSLGMKEATVFPELDLDKITRAFGMDITFVTSADTDQEAMELMRLLGMPFQQ
jgi:large subunit ribosomal protein L5